MIIFGLITEGLTDQIVIEKILAGFFNSPNIEVEPLQPKRNKDNQNKSQSGGWTLVFDYCHSKKFQESFRFFDYIIIQIDTDVLVDSENSNYNIPSRDDKGDELTPQQLIEKVIVRKNTSLRSTLMLKILNIIENFQNNIASRKF